MSVLAEQMAGARATTPAGRAVAMLNRSVIHVFLGAIATSERGSRRARRLVWTGWWATTVATVGGVLVYGPYAGSLPLGKTFDSAVLSDLVDQPAFAAKAKEGNYGFMRTNAAFTRSMEIAHTRWRWTEKRLNK